MTNTLYYGDNLKVLRDYEEVKIPSAHGVFKKAGRVKHIGFSSHNVCLLYTSDAADDILRVDLGGGRIIKKKIRFGKNGISMNTLHLLASAVHQLLVCEHHMTHRTDTIIRQQSDTIAQLTTSLPNLST